MMHYKIRHKDTGLWSLGGVDGDDWNKKGKVWTSMGALKNHLRLYITGGRYMSRPIPPEWEICLFEVTYSHTEAYSAEWLMRQH